MRRRTKIILVLGALVLLALGWLALKPEKEPEYQGKKLSEWMQELVEFESGLPGTNKFEVAIRNIGTNAIPYFVKWLEYEQPPWKTWLYRTATRLLPNLHWKDHSEELAYAGARGLQILGPMAIPELARLAITSHSRGVRCCAMDALVPIPTAGFTALICTLTNQPPSDFTEVQPFFNRALLFVNSPLAARQTVFKWLNDRDERVVLTAIRITVHLPNELSSVWSSFISRLKDPRATVRAGAIDEVEGYWAGYFTIVPAILELKNDPDPQVRRKAEAALPKIHSNALAQIALNRCRFTNEIAHVRTWSSDVVEHLESILGDLTNSLPK